MGKKGLVEKLEGLGGIRVDIPVERDKDTKYVFTEEFEADLRKAKNYLNSSDAPKGPFHVEELYNALEMDNKLDWNYKRQLFDELLTQNYLHSAGALMINGYLTRDANKRIQDDPRNWPDQIVG